ncbi:methyl-accepting chemotaxis protein [Rivularia sp. PCC 7116]|uniref:methyl-accepting chemotaxis protein n=1 Tax=Rivularia sp. PCC 7116 TaxID=373994 RepID=UPI00029F3D18|nr:methyl-accepting chemotaxis protein [Rivularia sp. PCC 7116]AFY53365.1 methyl-accepting chemotaxis protein [Rivularia sp. PCC 7116]
MAPSIDYEQMYKQAYNAYVNQNYTEAATLIDQVVQHLTKDPNALLLKGHVYYVLQKYNIAKEAYNTVLNLTTDQELLDFARNGLENISHYQAELDAQSFEVDNGSEDIDLPDSSSEEIQPAENLFDESASSSNSDSNNFTFSSENASEDEGKEVTDLLNEAKSPFDIGADSQIFDAIPNFEEENLSEDNPFAQSELKPADTDVHQNGEGVSKPELELPSFWQEDISASNSKDSAAAGDDSSSSGEEYSPFSKLEVDDNSNQNQFAPSADLPPTSSLQEEDLFFEDNPGEDSESFSLPSNFFSEDFSVDDTQAKTFSSSARGLDRVSDSFSEMSSVEEDFSREQSSELLESSQLSEESTASEQNKPGDDSFDLDAFEEVFGAEDFVTNNEDTKSIAKAVNTNSSTNSSNIEYLDDFDEFDDLGNISGFDLSNGNPAFSDVIPDSGSLRTNGALSGENMESSLPSEISNSISNDELGDSIDDDAPVGERDAELFSITNSQEAVPVFTQNDDNKVEAQVNVEQGVFAALENAPLKTKQWLTAGIVGVVSSVVVATVSFGATSISPANQRESIRNTGWIMAFAAGIAGFVTTGAMGHLTLKQVRRTTKDLETQFNSVRKGNLNAQATVYSEDEFGQLAAGFNEMARVIFTTTHEATRKAQEQEEAKENLQRQVIRLLDDVEGAARGDLTVQAEVTADVLGAVADAFNLTIQNLRDIVQQVKVAAREVTKGATNSETFARALSSDALRQAEELAVTLNSVQVMTDSIQRVAEAAREAEAVARDASEIALKGGEAVENTVAGILEIRETVAETTRKVKRLAESSQEISKIVALISQIASRTNLLALNASIEAARAGESGRGFAIVADEVRQLADKSAKSLKEIEQIVMQIQSETGSVMTAMEEGTQQVIKGTKLAEEAKRSLENIIQVANRIDILVRSITTDTVEQTETSRAVAHVMQSVELTAQETSQEAQRVSGALQHLVGVSRDLISSVERFRVETAESR